MWEEDVGCTRNGAKISDVRKYEHMKRRPVWEDDSIRGDRRYQTWSSPNSLSTLWGSYGWGKEWRPSRCPFASAAFGCAGSRRVPFATTVSHGLVAAGFWFLLPGVRALFEAKHGFTWQAQEIGWFWRVETWVCVAGARNRTLFVKIVAGAVFCGRCQNVGKRASFEGLRFTWQPQGIRTMDPMFWDGRARFLRRVAFLELELEDQFAWPL